MADGFRFGIEEEYFLACADTGQSPERTAAERFHAAARKAVAAVSHELLAGQLEVCTEPGHSLDEARADLARKRRRLAEIAGDQGLLLFAAGSHPLAAVAAQRTTQMARYRRLEREFGLLAHRMMVCALHVHVEVPAPERRVEIMARLTAFLPLFLALSAGSPFWEGRHSGQKAFRLSVFSEWPRMGLPEFFADHAAYEGYVAMLAEAGLIRDASFVWWWIRPSAHYPTLELRICDSCTRLEDAIAIAALFRCLVRALARQPHINANPGPLERAVCAENIWQAQHDGTAARLVDPESGAVRTVGEMLEAALRLVAEDASALGCGGWLSRTRTIVADGSSADRQLATSGRADGDLLAVVRDLAACSVAAEPDNNGSKL